MEMPDYLDRDRILQSEEFKELSKDMYVPYFMRDEVPDNAVDPELGFFSLPLFEEVYRSMGMSGEDPVEFFEKSWSEYRARKKGIPLKDKYNIKNRMLSYFGIAPDGYRIYDLQTPFGDMLYNQLIFMQMYKTSKECVEKDLMNEKQLALVRTGLVRSSRRFMVLRDKQFDVFNAGIDDYDGDDIAKDGLRSILDAVHNFYCEKVDGALPEDIIDEVKRMDEIYDGVRRKEIMLEGKQIYVPVSEPEYDINCDIVDAEILDLDMDTIFEGLKEVKDRLNNAEA